MLKLATPCVAKPKQQDLHTPMKPSASFAFNCHYLQTDYRPVSG